VVHLLLLARRHARTGLCADGGHPSQAGLRPGGIVSRPEDSGGEIKNRVAAAAKKTRSADVDGRDSARRNAGERFARPTTGGQKRLAGVHHQPAGIFEREGNGINGRFSNLVAAFLSAGSAEESGPQRKLPVLHKENCYVGVEFSFTSF